MVHRQSPLAKGLERAQREGQTTGNTGKRGKEHQDPRPPKRRRREVSEGPDGSREGPRDNQDPEASPTSPRSRWERWQAARPSPTSPDRQTPTKSGSKGSLAQGQVRHNVPGPPSQGRVGPGKGRPAQGRRTRQGREPPEQRDHRDTHPQGRHQARGEKSHDHDEPVGREKSTASPPDRNR